MKKVLILGDANSIWIRDYVKYVLLPEGYKVYISCTNGNSSAFSSFYSDNNISIIENSHKESIFRRIPFIARLCEKIDFNRSLCAADFFAAINIYVTPTTLFLMHSRKLQNVKKYCVYIGSDLLRASSKKCKKMNKELKKNDVAVICDSIKLSHAYNQRICNNIQPKIIYFGTGNLRFIDEQFRLGVENAKSEIGIVDITKTTVCIGYNAIESQQHLKVIEEIQKLSIDIKRKTIFLLPMAYGGDNCYINSVEKKLKESEVDYMILRSFLDAKQIAQLRVATDIFINSQKTDDLSASVIEALNAGCIILNGEWLEYPDLEASGIYFKQLFTFDNLAEILSLVISRNIQRERIPKDRLSCFISWDDCRTNWRRLLNE